MPDIFERETSVRYANEQACWDLLAGVQARAERGLLEITPNVSQAEIRIGTETGSTFFRDTLEDARQSLVDNDAEMKTVNLELNATTEPGHSWTWEAKVWALAMAQHETLLVKVSGQSRVAVEGLASTLSSYLVAGAKNKMPPVSGGRDGSSRAMEPTTRPASWLRATWRDHTAALVITVVGGVIVIALGVALGIAPRS